MKQKWLSVLLVCPMLLAACGNSSAADGSSPAETSAAESSAAPETQADASSLAVASGDDVIAADAVGYEGMQPVPAASVKEGEYEIAVDSSSSMFRIASCKLTVADGRMTAALTINSKSYEYLYAGTAGQAAQGGAAQ